MRERLKLGRFCGGGLPPWVSRKKEKQLVGSKEIYQNGQPAVDRSCFSGPANSYSDHSPIFARNSRPKKTRHLQRSCWKTPKPPSPYLLNISSRFRKLSISGAACTHVSSFMSFILLLFLLSSWILGAGAKILKNSSRSFDDKILNKERWLPYESELLFFNFPSK